jgi:hypothetical protein
MKLTVTILALVGVLEFYPCEVQGFSTGVFTRQPAFQSITKSTTSKTLLWGILDEIQSDAYQLSSPKKDNKGDNSDVTDAYEVFLADLVFSTNDPRVDIMNRIDLAGDPDFIAWLQKKADQSRDPEERVALKDLYEMIDDIQTRVKVNQLAQERAAAETSAEAISVTSDDDDDNDETSTTTPMTTADILRKATAIQTQTSEEAIDARKVKKTFYETELTPEIRYSYEGLMKKILPPYKPGDSPTSVVFNYYDQFDAQCVKLLNERVVTEAPDAADCQAVLDALAVEQQKRIAVAAESLKQVLAAGEPRKMEGVLVRLAREGKIDEPFLLLIEANQNQAKAAGANGPAELMERLKKRAIDEKDKQSTSKEIRLIRQLLRTESASEREKILESAFTPKDVLLVPGTAENARKAVDGEMPEQEKPQPDVSPPKFIDTCKAVLLNFGNLATDDDDRGDLATRIKKIAAEAEVVATRIYGQGMTLREQQDRMWKEQTTSIFDLERMELEAEQMGDRAPWTNPDSDGDMFVPGFDSQGRMQIGGT